MSTSPAAATWGHDFDPDRLARLELRMWKAYYRRQPVRLMTLLIQANHEQAGVSWPRAVAAAFVLARAAAGFGRSDGDYDRFLPDIVRGYRMLGLPETVDAQAVARRELRWWVVRREIGLAAGEAAGDVIADLYAELYHVPKATVAEAGRLRGLAAEVRDRGAEADPDGPTGPGKGCWPEVARLLRDSYRSLSAALRADGRDGRRSGRRRRRSPVGERLRVRDHLAPPRDARRDRRDPRRRRRPRPLVAVGLPRGGRARARRHAAGDPTVLSAIPAPPGPTFRRPAPR